MDSLYLTEFDLQLTKSIPHLENYPQMLPFIGKNWKRSKCKILLVAESHYLPAGSNAKSVSDKWYSGSVSLLNKTEQDWTHTRNIIRTADFYAVTKINHSRGHSIFYNIKNAVFEAKKIDKRNITLFENLSFYNYFQRPAEFTGNSIVNNPMDEQIAFRTLTEVVSAIKPTIVLFVSKKAYNSFKCNQNIVKSDIFKDIIIDTVSHPASRWWNKASWANGNSKEKLSGKQKFINLINKSEFEII